MKLSSLIASKVVKMTTAFAVSNENFIKMIFPLLWPAKYCSGNNAIWAKFSSLVSTKAVKMTISGEANDDNFFKITFPLQRFEYDKLHSEEQRKTHGSDRHRLTDVPHKICYSRNTRAAIGALLGHSWGKTDDFPADTRRNYNVIMTSKRRWNIVLT